VRLQMPGQHGRVASFAVGVAAPTTVPPPYRPEVVCPVPGKSGSEGAGISLRNVHRLDCPAAREIERSRALPIVGTGVQECVGKSRPAGVGRVRSGPARVMLEIVVGSPTLGEGTHWGDSSPMGERSLLWTSIQKEQSR
jgi:hypothetical protein